MKSAHLISLLLLASCLGAQAQVVEVSPFFGYRWGGDFEISDGQESSLDGGEAYGLCLEVFPEDFPGKFALLWSRQESSFDVGGFNGQDHLGMTVDVFQIGGVYEERKGRFLFSVAGLLGASVFNPEQCDTEARFCVTIGGGVKYFLLDRLALRADLRGYCTVVESEAAFISSGGQTIATFSGTTLWQGEISAGITLAF